MKKLVTLSIVLLFCNFLGYAQPGSLDLSFNPIDGANARVSASALHPNGKLLIGGLFSEYQFNPLDVSSVSVESTGNIDNAFFAGGYSNFSTPINVSKINKLSTGEIIIGGSKQTFSGAYWGMVSKRNSSGADISAFNPVSYLNESILSLAIQSDNKIVYGNFCTDSSNASILKYKLIRLNPTNGSVDATFNTGSGPNNGVNAIAIQTDGKIIIGGTFTSYNGTLKNYIARVNTNGTIDNTFNIGSGFSSLAVIRSIKIQSDGKVLVAGDFTTYNGTNRSGIVRINTNGSIDTSFNPGTGAQGVSETGVYDMAIQTDGKILIVGNFLSYNGTSIKSIARLNTTGTLDATFNPALGANNTIRTVLILPDDKIIIGGDFTSYNGITRNKVARLLNCSPPTITSTTPNSRCGNGTVVLNAAVSTGTLNWYSVSTGGSVLGTGTSYTTPSISSNTTYYVEATNAGCTSTRTAVMASVNVVPTITSTTPNSRCGNGTVILNAAASTGTLNWYSVSTGGSVLGTGTTYTTPSISSNTTYYVEATNAGCTSTRTAVMASVNIVPTITSTTPNSRCGNGTVVLNAAASTGTLNWYSVFTGGSVLGTGTTYTTPSISSNTTYYVEATNAGCTSTRTAVMASVISIPSSVINQNGNILTSADNGMTYQWIDCDNSNSPISGETSQVFTALTQGSYAVQVNNQGCINTSSCVNVIFTNINSINSINSIKLFPNPILDNLVYIETIETIDLVKIYDSFGKIVFEYKNIQIGKTQLDLSNLSGGIYYIKSSSQHKNYDGKLIKN